MLGRAGGLGKVGRTDRADLKCICYQTETVQATCKQASPNDYD